MDTRQTRNGSLIGGVILIILGLFALAPRWLVGFSFWNTAWPFIIIGVGLAFFAGMFAGGKSLAALAIPGSIVTTVGLILFVQNLTGHWESWSYAWTFIVMSVGLGIFIAGQYSENEHQRQAGLRVLTLGAVMLVVFGAFFGMIFNYYGLSQYVLPGILILLGIYILVKRSGVLPGTRRE